MIFSAYLKKLKKNVEFVDKNHTQSFNNMFNGRLTSAHSQTLGPASACPNNLLEFYSSHYHSFRSKLCWGTWQGGNGLRLLCKFSTHSKT